LGIFDNILYGFQVTFQPLNILFCAIGVLVGTLVGVLPGIGPAGAMALLLPATFRFSPTSTLILLAGIYYGVQYGGSTTSILVNIPGEASSVITCIDGYQMARQGRAGPALGIAAWGSFIAGTFANLGLVLVAVPLAKAALSFGPPEYFALMCTGLIIVTYLAQGSILKALMMALVGIILGSIGLDVITGLPRFTFGINELTDGVGIIPLVMGLFGVSEIFINLEGTLQREIYKTRIRNLWPSLKDWAQAKWAIVRGSVIGFLLGILPGGGAVISTFVAYAVEKKVSKDPERFGKGAIEGVAGPESATMQQPEALSFHSFLSESLRIRSWPSSFCFDHSWSPTRPPSIKENPDLFWVWLQAYIWAICFPPSEPSFNRPVGEGPRDSIQASLPNDPPLLSHRGLQHPQCDLRSLCNDLLRGSGMDHEEVWLRGRSPHPCLCPGSHAGTGPSAIPSDYAGEFYDLHFSSYLRRCFRNCVSSSPFKPPSFF
jgi:hypothetical protein